MPFQVKLTEMSRNFPRWLTRLISLFRRPKTAEDEIDQKNPYRDPRRRDASEKKGKKRPKVKRIRTTQPVLAAASILDAGTSNEGNIADTPEALKEQRRLRNKDLVEERSKKAKRNKPNNSLRSMTVVSKSG